MQTKGRRKNNCRRTDVEHVFNVLGTMESCPTYFCAGPYRHGDKNNENSQSSDPPIAIVAGNVKTQARMIFSPSPQRTLDMPRVAPRPKTLPVIVWVVDTGTPMLAVTVSTSAALVSAAKPSGGPSFVK